MHGIFALLVRTLRQDSRRWQSAALRAVLLLFLLLVLVGMTSRGNPTTAGGLTFVSWILWFSYVSITLAGFYWFSSAISEEREERSLGLLRMTGLNGVAILVGKWFPRVLLVVLLISTQFPLALLGVTLGGVLPRQLMAGFVALLAYTVMMSGLGLLASTVSQTTRRAGFNVAWFWVALTFLPSMATKALTAELMRRSVISAATADQCYSFYDSVRQLSLWHRLDAILSIMPDESLWDVQVRGNLCIGLIAMVLAWFVFEYLAVYNLEVTSGVAPKKRIVNRIFSGKDIQDKRRGTRFAVGRVWRSALAWREFHFSTGGWITVIAKLFIYGCVPPVAYLIGLRMGMGRSVSAADFIGVAFMIIGGTAVLGELAFYSGRIFGPEIYETTLPSIMLLPMSIARIAFSKVCGFLLALTPGVLCFLLGCAIQPGHGAVVFETVFSLEGLISLSVVLTFLYLAVYLSLHTRAGVIVAFLLLFAAITMVNILIYVVIGPRMRNVSGNAIGLVLLIVMWCTSAFLHYRIGKSLQAKAAI